MNEERKFFWENSKKIIGLGGGGQGGCERRIEVFVKIQKRIVGVGSGVGGGCQGRRVRRSEVFVKIQKNIGGGGVSCQGRMWKKNWICVKIEKKMLGRGRVDVNEELKFL